METIILLAAFAGCFIAGTAIVLTVIGWFFSMIREDQNAKSGMFDLEDGDF